MFRNTFLSTILGSLLLASAAQAAPLQIDYRSGSTAPWQYYTTVNTPADADQVVASLQESGFQTQVTPTATPGNFSYGLNPIYAAPVIGSGFYGSYHVNRGYTWGGRGWHYGWRNGGHRGWHGGHHWGHHGIHHGVHHVHHGHAHHGGHHGGHHR